MSNDVFVFDAVRTPRGRGKQEGTLHEVKPVDLVVTLLKALQARNAGLDTKRVDDIVLGIVSPLSDQGAVLPKTAAMVADWDVQVPGLQINRFCASGLEAVNLAAQKIASGWEDLVVCGGVESMSRVPLGSDGGAWAMDPRTNLKADFITQGIGADLIAAVEGFTREQADAFAYRSQMKAAAAKANGSFSKSIVPVKDMNGITILAEDEYNRPDTTMEGLAKLKPSFQAMGEMAFDAIALQKYHWIERIEHIHSPGNSSGIVDGASALLLGNGKIAKELGLKPRARIVATAVTSTDPTIMLTGPGPACEKALRKAGLRYDDIDLFEVNEAFASVVMRFMKDSGVSEDRINVNGGSIALGHPLGATGGILVGTVIDELERRGKKRGMCTLCVGGGMGIATIVELV